MALIKCSECGTEISDQAAACVKCGAPVAVAATKKTTTTKKKSPKGAFITLAVVGVVAIIIETTSGSHKDTAAAAPVEASALYPSSPPIGTVDATSDAVALAAAAAAASQAQADAEASAAAAEAASEAANAHNYVMEQDGEYGYQPGVSTEDRNQGVAAKALMMVRYRGLIDGAYTADQILDGATFRLDCKDPCQYVRVRGIVDGQVVNTQTLPNNPDSMAGAIMSDAQSGKLKVYKAAQ